MERLLKWITEFNVEDYDPSTFDHDLSDVDLNFLTACYKQNLINLFVKRHNENDKTNYPIRPSMLGKPALVVAYNYYHPGENKTLPNPITRITNIGYYFEQWLCTQIMRLGYTVDVDLEETITIEGIDIFCHIDIMVTDHSGNNLIIECKEVSDWYYKSWIDHDKAQDDRGYLTQASLYSEAFNTPLVWVMGNRVSGHIGMKGLDVETKNRHLNRVFSIMNVLINRTTCWEECFKYMRPEPPNETKKGLTVPFGMKPIADVVYIRDDKGYVLDYRYPKGYEEYKPEL